jgi:hypothetical protein
LDCGLKALSEVRRSDAAPAAISQTFRVNARNLLSSDRFTNFRNLARPVPLASKKTLVQIND